MYCYFVIYIYIYIYKPHNSTSKGHQPALTRPPISSLSSNPISRPIPWHSTLGKHVAFCVWALFVTDD